MTGAISEKDVLQSQILRAKELYGDLKQEVEKDLQNSTVSLRTMEITEDVLVKLRDCLDKAINLYSQKKGFSDNRNLYFPIASTFEDFQKKEKGYLKELIE